MYEPNTSSSFFSSTENLRILIFSPILAVIAIVKLSIVSPLTSIFLASSKVLASLFKIASPTVLTKFLNSSFLATKSVSLLTSRTTALLPLVNIAANPSEKCRIYLKNYPQGISRVHLNIDEVDYLIEEQID